ncbi:MAG: tripartite tricarboxylate transporter TctB family protein [Desulfobacterales bacterium]|nr:tripartite tricarboxylate transporter TctB family protein [Desulfobacterales bacterium]
MKLSNNSYFLFVVMLAMLVLFFSSLSLEFYASKLLPLFLSSSVFILSLIAFIQEIISPSGCGADKAQHDRNTGGKPAGLWRSFFPVGIWVLSFFLLIWLAGYLVAIPVFLFSYTRFHGSKWVNALLIGGITLATIYGIFELGLDITLYRGVLLSG